MRVVTRLGKIAVALAASTSATSAFAGSGEALVQVHATDSVSGPAERATWRVQLLYNGDTVEAARRASDVQRQQMTNAIEAAGGGMVNVRPITAMGFVGNEQYDPESSRALMGAGTVAGPPAVKQQQTVVSHYEVTLSDLSRMDKVKSVIQQFAGKGPNEPAYSLVDPEPARRRASALATSKARRDAETLAAAAGMRLGPVRRISNYATGLGFDRMNEDMLSRLFGRAETPGTVVTSATVYVDFAIEPK